MIPCLVEMSVMVKLEAMLTQTLLTLLPVHFSDMLKYSHRFSIPSLVNQELGRLFEVEYHKSEEECKQGDRSFRDSQHERERDQSGLPSTHPRVNIKYLQPRLSFD